MKINSSVAGRVEEREFKVTFYQIFFKPYRKTFHLLKRLDVKKGLHLKKKIPFT